MAELELAVAGKKPGVRRAKKLSTKVDLTPMVDLGFLLITFFVFSTKMGEPVVVKLNMPKESTDSLEVAGSTALTVFPSGDGKIYYYNGSLKDALESGDYGITTFSYSDGIGEVIRNKKVVLERQKKGRSMDLFMMIKPEDESNYRQLVDMLDEATINEVKHYAISSINDEEKELIKKLKASQ